MLVPRHTKKFDKHVKRAKKRGKDMKKLRDIMSRLINEKPLMIKHRDHKLVGALHDCRECHIEPDWLLVYRIQEKEIYFVGTGTHADLFSS